MYICTILKSLAESHRDFILESSNLQVETMVSFIILPKKYLQEEKPLLQAFSAL
jgi:hypothetical protein